MVTLRAPSAAIGAVRALRAHARGVPALSGAGVEADVAVRVAGTLAERGFGGSLQYIAAPAGHPEQAEEHTRDCLRLLDRVADAGLAGRADVLLRPGALGLGLGPEGRALAADNLARICAAARETGTRVTLDAEDGPGNPASAAPRLVAEVRAVHPALGGTLPPYPGPSAADLRALAAPGARVRLRGADRPRPPVPGRHAADLAFVRTLRTLMPGPASLVVATRDPRLIEIAGTLAVLHERSSGGLEYELPHGVRPVHLYRLRARGARVRVRVLIGRAGLGPPRRIAG
ncbi:proline dehydrogenase [Marinactinospora rubrisoli]|uniref:Proline dehydrogenase n=1 Tax=Marinactinospora rubrisoli TaxID=2715399 RepID=A0ABW2KHA2_9ACTN